MYNDHSITYVSVLCIMHIVYICMYTYVIMFSTRRGAPVRSYYD